MSNLWWTKWRWTRLSSYYFGFPLSLSSSTLYCYFFHEDKRVKLENIQIQPSFFWYREALDTKVLSHCLYTLNIAHITNRFNPYRQRQTNFSTLKMEAAALLQMSVHFYELLAVRAKQVATFNEKESTCSTRQHENKQEQSCGASVAPNQGYRRWKRVNTSKSVTPPPPPQNVVGRRKDRRT